MSAEIKYMDIQEFREAGYLQEVNRRFLHPLGLALEVAIEKCRACDGTGNMEDGPAGATYSAPCSYCGATGRRERLGGVWDYRDDPEGVYYAEGAEPDAAKAARVRGELEAHAETRVKRLGYIVQPVAP